MNCFGCCGEDDIHKVSENGPFVPHNSASNNGGYYMKEASPKETQAVKVQPIAVPAISIDELKEKTDNFSADSLIGEGSYGRVYFGVLRSGQSAAIKKLDSSKQPDVEFLAQVSMVSRLKQENVVELVGYCTDGPLRVLVYEHASKGSLHDILHGKWCHIISMFSTLSHHTNKDHFATPKLSEDKVKQCVDTKLNGEYPSKAVAKVPKMMAAVAALCVQYEADFRPNMSIVVKALQPLLNTRPGPPQ
ncbi:hypothetical protein Patl1_24749 [Pistacia atlantica]|uniref:Uncharacterized protein n=1 Tax=Pistacia atlantica TaxID=434234 RepID=A0ACC1B4A3_9ROSI|nr:hypothetical protein Patl1_24749 [Pistacia atlantica]